MIERTDFKKDNKLDFRTYEESSHLPVFLDKEREHEEKVESPIEADVFPHTNLLKSELDGEESLVLNEADSEKALSHTNQGEVPKELVKNESTLTTRDERLEEDDLESLLEKEKDHAPAFHKWEEADQMLNSDPEEKYYLESLFAETEEEEFTTDSSSLQPRDREEHLSQQEDSIFISQEGMLKDGWQEEDFIDPFDEYELDKRLKINDKKTAGLPKHKLDHALDSSLEKRNS
ncbi:MAG TPA: hypothetical protein VEY51_03635 [Chondromyces sp.]|nr:hypothetical protein [Chondromyces sp.]